MVMAARVRRFWNRMVRGVIAGGALSLLAACATHGAAPSFTSLSGDSEYGPGSDSLFGNYLAARHAGKEQDAASAAHFYSAALEHSPGDMAILERAFLLEMNSGDMADTVRLARKIVRVRPDDRLARLMLAANALRLGSYNLVRDHLEASSEGPLTDLISIFLVAWSHAGEGQIEKAVAHLDNLDAAGGLDVYKAYHRGLIHDMAGHEARAESNYDEAMTLSERSVLRITQAYGHFLERQGRFKQAQAIYETFSQEVGSHPLMAAAAYRASRENPTDVVTRLVPDARSGGAEAVFSLALALARELDRGPDLPIVYMRLALFLRPDYPVAQSTLAAFLERNNRVEEAVDVYESVSRASPLWANARIRIAHGLNKLERKDEAISTLEEVIEIAPDNLDVLTSIAELQHANKHYKASAEYYSRAVAQLDQVEQRHWSLFYQYAIALEQSGDWETAEGYFKKALELEPNQPFVLNYLGYTWVDMGQNLEQAMDMIRLAVELKPQNGFIIDSLGWGYYQLGQYEKAVEHLEQAVLLEPADPIINDHLGDAYWKVGRKLEARFQWRHALALNPDEETEERASRKLRLGFNAVREDAARDEDPVPEATATAEAS